MDKENNISGALIKIVSLIVAVVVLFIISKRIISSGATPTLSDYIAKVQPVDENASTTNFYSSLMTLIGTSTAATSTKYVAVTAPKGQIKAEVVADEASRTLGLSNRTSLPSNQGMLFVLDNPGIPGFWMKDMKFPLDIVWISAKKKVVSVSAEVTPENFPEIYTASAPILYVLEINSGLAKKLGLVTGASVDFNLNK